MSEKKPVANECFKDNKTIGNLPEEFWGKDKGTCGSGAKFKPILPFTVPHMVFPMENFAERMDKLKELFDGKLDLQSNTDYNTPTDFYNQDEGYHYWKSKLFTNFFAREIELISKSFFDYMMDTYENSEGFIQDFPYNGDKDIYYDDAQHGMMVTSAWIEQAQTFHQHLPHDHGHETFSCILYAEYDEQTHDPVSIISPYKSPEGMTFHYNPRVKEGDIVVIPGNVLHFTTQNRSVKPRTVVVFNLMLKSYVRDFAKNWNDQSEVTKNYVVR